jgi:hypothetical protein
MIAVNASTPLQHAPRQAAQAPVEVNPPASFETEAKPVSTGQDTAEFSQTQAPPTETAEGREASPEKKQVRYKKGLVAPFIVGSVATGIGTSVATFGKEEGRWGSFLGAALAASIALFGASVLARRNEKIEVPTPASGETPAEVPAADKPVA